MEHRQTQAYPENLIRQSNFGHKKAQDAQNQQKSSCVFCASLWLKKVPEFKQQHSLSHLE